MTDDDLAVEDSEESWLGFVVALKSLARSEHLAQDDRLSAIVQACDLALADHVTDATDFVDKVNFGLIK